MADMASALANPNFVNLSAPQNYWTPAQVAAQREYARQLLGDNAPIQSKWQGLAHATKQLLGGYQMADAGQREQQARQSQVAAALGAVRAGDVPSALATTLNPWTPPEAGGKVLEASLPILQKDVLGNVHRIDRVTGRDLGIVMQEGTKGTFKAGPGTFEGDAVTFGQPGGQVTTQPLIPNAMPSAGGTQPAASPAPTPPPAPPPAMPAGGTPGAASGSVVGKPGESIIGGGPALPTANQPGVPGTAAPPVALGKQAFNERFAGEQKKPASALPGLEPIMDTTRRWGAESERAKTTEQKGAEAQQGYIDEGMASHPKLGTLAELRILSDKIGDPNPGTLALNLASKYGIHLSEKQSALEAMHALLLHLVPTDKTGRVAQLAKLLEEKGPSAIQEPPTRNAIMDAWERGFKQADERGAIAVKYRGDPMVNEIYENSRKTMQPGGAVQGMPPNGEATQPPPPPAHRTGGPGGIEASMAGNSAGGFTGRTAINHKTGKRLRETTTGDLVP